MLMANKVQFDAEKKEIWAYDFKGNGHYYVQIKNEIINGTLTCSKCDDKFKISRGIPRFVVDTTKDFVRTEMAQSFIDKHGEEVVKQGITLDRLTEPKDISPLVSLIVSGQMDHSTGSTIDVNGGSFLR